MTPLQDVDLIVCALGVAPVHDRGGLEAAACACYRIVREEHRRLIGS